MTHIRSTPGDTPALRRAVPGMEALDALEWGAGLAFAAYGVRVAVRANAPSLVSRVIRRLPPGWRHTASPVVDRLYSLRQDDAARPTMLVRLQGRVAELPGVPREVEVPIGTPTARAVLSAVAGCHPMLRRQLFRADGTPRSSAFVLVDGRPVRDPGATITAESGGRFRLYRGARLLARSNDLDEVLDVFASDAHLYVAAWAPRRVFIHAGVVAWRGRAMVLPGRSFSGKSTLVAALVEAGATYYSDEYAVLDAAGRVHAFQRPISLRTGRAAAPAPPASEDGGGAARPRALPAVPISLVVLTGYRPGAAWRPERVSPGGALLDMLSNAVPARRRPAAVLRSLARALASARAVRSPRGEAGDVAATLLELLSAT